MLEAAAESSQENFRERFIGSAPQVTDSASWPGVEFLIFDQDLSSPSTWSKKSNEHVVTVFLSGFVEHMEMELSGNGVIQKTPLVGEICVFPAFEKRVGLAYGKRIRFAQLTLDPNSFQEVTGRHIDLPPIQARLGHYDEFLLKTVRRMEHLIQQADDMAAMLAQSLSQNVYLHVFREYTDRQISTQRPHRVLRFLTHEKKKVSEYINENLDHSISLHQLAELVEMKLHPFFDAFRESYGTTPAQYIIEQRLQRAQLLLTTTKADITTIALDTGFSNHSHLTNVFRTRLGVTPKEFRAAQR